MPIMLWHVQTGHGNPNTLKVRVFEVVEKDIRGGDRLKRLLQQETFWIVELKGTTYPGLIDEIDFSPFLWNITSGTIGTFYFKYWTKGQGDFVVNVCL